MSWYVVIFDAFQFSATLSTGYTVASAVNTRYGLTAQLSLAGRACNAFGHDYEHLTIEVTYESVSRY